MSKSGKCERENLVLRMVWMLVYFVVWQLAELLLLGMALAQLIIRIIRGAPNDALMVFGGSLSLFMAQIGRFATFRTNDKPWPFADWPAERTVLDSAQDLTKLQP